MDSGHGTPGQVVEIGLSHIVEARRRVTHVRSGGARCGSRAGRGLHSPIRNT